MSSIRYLWLFAYSGVQLILCFVLFVFVLCLVCSMFPVSLECPFMIAPLVSITSIANILINLPQAHVTTTDLGYPVHALLVYLLSKILNYSRRIWRYQRGNPKKDKQCNGQEFPLIITIILSPQNISGRCNRLTMSVLDEGHVMHTKLYIYVFIRKIMLPLTFKKNILQSRCTRMDAISDKSYHGTV